MKICKNILFLTLSAFFLTPSAFAIFGPTVLTDDFGIPWPATPFKASVAKWDPSGRYLAVAAGAAVPMIPIQGEIRIYDSQSPTPLTPVITAGTGFQVFDLAWDPAGSNQIVVVGKFPPAPPVANVEIWQFNPGVPSLTPGQSALINNDAFDVYWAPPGLVMGIMGTILVMADNTAGNGFGACSELYAYDPTTAPLAPPAGWVNPIPFDQTGGGGGFPTVRADWDAHSVAWLNWDTGFIPMPGFGGEVALAERKNNPNFNQVNVYQIDGFAGGPRVIQSAAGPLVQSGVSTVAWQPGSTSVGGGILVSGEFGGVNGTASLYTWAAANPWIPNSGILALQQTQPFGPNLYPKDIGWEVDPTVSDTFAVVGYNSGGGGRGVTGAGRLYAYEIDGTNKFSPIATSQTDYAGPSQVWAVDWLNTDTVAVGGLDMIGTNDVAVYYKAPPAPPPPAAPEQPPSPPALDCSPTIIDGTSNNQYKTSHYIFPCNGSAKGVVIFNQGFTILPNRVVSFDVWIPHKGFIDLRDTGVLSLDGDFYFGSAISGGNISGNGNTLFLENNLSLTNRAVLHVSSDLMINGQGNDIILGPWTQLFVDTNVTLTLKNLQIKNAENNQGFPFIKLATHCSKLCLDNVTIVPNQDLYFDQGQLFIHNDVVISGTSTFVYRSTQPAFITQDATLLIMPNATFFYDTASSYTPSSNLPSFNTPNSRNNELINFENETSMMFFDQCTFQISHTGLRLTKGTIFFDNRVVINNKETSYLSNLTTVTYTNFGEIANAVDWSPDGYHLAVTGTFGTNNLVIYSFNGSTLSITNSAYVGPGTAYSVDWSPDSKFIAVGSNYDKREIMIFKWKDQSLQLTSSLFSGDAVYTVKWNPDNKYLAVGADYNRFDLVIYGWNGVDFITTNSINHGNAVYAIAWHPSGKYLVAGGDYGGQDVIVYQWEPATYTFSAKATLDFGNGARGLKWSPDGRYLAVAGDNSTKDFVIYEWTGNDLIEIVSQSHGTIAYTVDWSNNGRYVVVGGDNGSTDVITYEFDGANLNIVDQKNHDAGAKSVALSRDDNFLAVAGNHNTSPFDKDVIIYRNNYTSATYVPSYNNGLIWGDSAKGTTYDLDIYILAGADVDIQGTVLYDDAV